MNEYVFELDIGSKPVTETVVAQRYEEAWVVVATRIARYGSLVRSIFLLDWQGTPYKPKG